MHEVHQCESWNVNMLRPGSWTRPARVSPVREGTGAPGRRPQSVGEIWRAAGGRKPLWTEQARGQGRPDQGRAVSEVENSYLGSARPQSIGLVRLGVETQRKP